MGTIKKKYDLFSPTFKANPFPTFAQMRQGDPIYAHHSPNGGTIWYITRFAEVTAVLKDNDHFVKDFRNTLPPGAKQPRKSSMHRLINENMLFADPPDHTRLRALVNQAFTPRRVEQLAPRVQQITDALLDGIAAAGQADLIADFALPMPVRIIAELLGIPAEDQAEVADWSQAIISPGSRNLNYSARKKKVRAFVAYLQEMFALRQKNPQDDLITALVQAEEAGERLNEAELSSMVALLLVTGHETTVNLLGNGALALLTHPEQLAILRENGGWETAVEELLRFDGPVETSTTRWVREDFTFEGHQMRRGDVVRVVLASANRDGCHFAQPNALDVTRRDNRHLAFGMGIHYCLGAPLARLEGQIGLQTLFDRFPKLKLAVPTVQLEWRSGVLFRGLKALPIVFG
ncbi:cytochrome P450 family protein [Candidatus Leptofilum sp.]|uniref:cytochrome P450 family protein n=1 Tax=Candidatus Leptofilum sp. TaxID=3241576 RepID=UPI003B5B78BA